jgi:hypothetical protein
MRSAVFDEGVGSMLECKLRAANGEPDVVCDGEFCTFWRVIDLIGVVEQGEWSGCAIQHFALLDGGRDVAAWLLSVKQRVEAEAKAEAGVG